MIIFFHRITDILYVREDVISTALTDNIQRRRSHISYQSVVLNSFLSFQPLMLLHTLQKEGGVYFFMPEKNYDYLLNLLLSIMPIPILIQPFAGEVLWRTYS